MELKNILQILSDENPKAAASDIRMYADTFMAYSEAQINIQKTGNIVSHPRTGAPIQNPYLKVRDGAQAVLRKMRGIKSTTVWKLIPVE